VSLLFVFYTDHGGEQKTLDFKKYVNDPTDYIRGQTWRKEPTTFDLDHSVLVYPGKFWEHSVLAPEATCVWLEDTWQLYAESLDTCLSRERLPPGDLSVGGKLCHHITDVLHELAVVVCRLAGEGFDATEEREGVHSAEGVGRIVFGVKHVRGGNVAEYRRLEYTCCYLRDLINTTYGT